MMIRIWHILSLIVLIQLPIDGGCEKYCPWGGKVKGDCSVDECSNGYLCTKWIVDTEKKDNKESLDCCALYIDTDPKKYCTETGMYSAEKRFGYNGYLWRWPPLESEYRWYKKIVEIGGMKFDAMCPMPVSHGLWNYDLNASIAVGFEPEGKTIATCETSDDCKEDEFCDAAGNPTFSDAKDDKDANMLKRAIDRSHPKKSLQPLHFCFKYLDFGGRLIYVKGNKKTGPAYCDKHAECQPLSQDPSYCHTEKSVYFVKNDQNDEGSFDGHCLRARICSKENHVSEYATLGAGGKFCDVNDPSTCPLPDSMANLTGPITPVCVLAHASTITAYNVSMCCYRLPEPTTTMTPTTEAIKSYSAYYQQMYNLILVVSIFSQI